MTTQSMYFVNAIGDKSLGWSGSWIRSYSIKGKQCLGLPERWYRARMVYRNLWYIVSLAHFGHTKFWFFESSQHLNTLELPMDLVFVLKWVKSILCFALYIFHLSAAYLILLTQLTMLTIAKQFMNTVVARPTQNSLSTINWCVNYSQYYEIFRDFDISWNIKHISALVNLY